MGLIIILVAFSIIGALLTSKLKTKIKKYSSIPNSSGMNGYEIGMAMIKYYNVSNVKIVEGKGRLTDHFRSPKTRLPLLKTAVSSH